MAATAVFSANIYNAAEAPAGPESLAFFFTVLINVG